MGIFPLDVISPIYEHPPRLCVHGTHVLDTLLCHEQNSCLDQQSDLKTFYYIFKTSLLH